MKTIEEICESLEEFEPEDGNWLELEQLLDKLWSMKHPEYGIKSMFSVFERFPDSDGNGVFWSMVHGIKQFSDYEKQLLASLERQPSVMGVVMVHKIANTDHLKIAGEDIKGVYVNLLRHSKLLPSPEKKIHR